MVVKLAINGTLKEHLVLLVSKLKRNNNMDNTTQHQGFDSIINAHPSTDNSGAVPLFVSGLIGIPFILVFLIALVITGSGKTALQSAFVVVLVGLLIGFVMLVF